METRRGRLLFSTSFGILCALTMCCTGETSIGERTFSDSQTVRRGERVVLRCHPFETPNLVLWRKGEDPKRSTVLVIRQTDGSVTGQCVSDRTCTMDDNYSLIIHVAHIADEGRYICVFGDYGNYHHHFSDLAIYVPPIDEYPVIHECQRRRFIKNHEYHCSIVAFELVNITCSVWVFYPTVHLFFRHGTYDIAPIKETELDNPDGTKNRSITIQASASDLTFDCIAQFMQEERSAIIDVTTDRPLNVLNFVLGALLVLALALLARLWIRLRRKRSRYISIPTYNEGLWIRRSQSVIGRSGGELAILSLGLTLRIPPGALENCETISVEAKDIPSNILLRDDEMTATCSINCFPSGLTFASLANLLIPHCAEITDPEEVQVVRYSWNHGDDENDMGAVTRSEQTTDSCQVSGTHINVTLQHFSGFFLTFKKNQNIHGKRMSLIAFLSSEMTLEYRMADKPHGTSWRDIHDVAEYDPYKLVEDQDDEINVTDEDLSVDGTCNDGSTFSETVKAMDLMKKSKLAVCFPLGNKQREDYLPVNIVMKQGGRGILNTYHPQRAGTVRKAAARSHFLEETVVRAAAGSHPQTRHSIFHGRRVTCRQLDELSRHLPPDSYYEFCANLGFTYNEAANAMEAHKENYHKAVRKCLEVWKDRERGTVSELTEILEKTGMSVLKQYIE